MIVYELTDLRDKFTYNQRFMIIHQLIYDITFEQVSS